MEPMTIPRIRPLDGRDPRRRGALADPRPLRLARGAPGRLDGEAAGSIQRPAPPLRGAGDRLHAVERTTGGRLAHPGDWLLAIAATCGPLLVQPGRRRAPGPAVAAARFVLLAGTLLSRSRPRSRWGGASGASRPIAGSSSAGPTARPPPDVRGLSAQPPGLPAMNPSPGNLAVYALCVRRAGPPADGRGAAPGRRPPLPRIPAPTCAIG